MIIKNENNIISNIDKINIDKINIDKINIFEPIHEKGYETVYIDRIAIELLNSNSIIYFSQEKYEKYKYSYNNGYKYGLHHGKIYGFGRYSSTSRDDTIVFTIGYIDGYNKTLRKFM